MKKLMMICMALALCACAPKKENEDNAVLKVAVHNESYGESLKELWEETYPEQTLEIRVVEDLESLLSEENEYDVYFVEDESIPKIIDDLKEVNVSCEINTNHYFHDVFDKVKKVYLPLVADALIYYMIDLDKTEQDHISLDTFSSFEKVMELDHGFYYYDHVAFTSAFITGNLNYFPGNEKNQINFTQDSFKEALQDYQTIMNGVKNGEVAEYDNWFIQDSYYSGFVTNEMQMLKDEEVNGKKVMFAKLPSIHGHPLYTTAISYGYVVNSKTLYPNAADHLIELMHSKSGMQLLCNDMTLIPLIPEADLDSFEFENIHIKEKAFALNASISRNWVGVPRISEGAIDYLYTKEVMDKMKVCDLETCGEELDATYREWLENGKAGQ